MTIAATLGRMLLISLWARSSWSRKYFATARQSFTVPLAIPSDMSFDSLRIRSSDRQLTSCSSEPLTRFSDFFVLDLLTVSFPPSVTVGQWSLSLIVGVKCVEFHWRNSHPFPFTPTIMLGGVGMLWHTGLHKCRHPGWLLTY